MQALKKQDEHYTYADYLTWGDEVRYELIDGEAYAMTAPLEIHQFILGELHGLLWNFLKGKSCQVFVAPYDVRLNPDTDDDTVVQPDLVVICDKTKRDGKACLGAPDLVIEIVSPSTAQMDRFVKYHKYLQAGVKEYWIVDPESRTVSVFVLKNGDYVHSVYSDADKLPSHVLEGCEINLSEVFNTE
jgi:Uma2 family endonuclease